MNLLSLLAFVALPKRHKLLLAPNIPFAVDQTGENVFILYPKDHKRVLRNSISRAKTEQWATFPSDVQQIVTARTLGSSNNDYYLLAVCNSQLFCLNPHTKEVHGPVTFAIEGGDVKDVVIKSVATQDADVAPELLLHTADGRWIATPGLESLAPHPVMRGQILHVDSVKWNGPQTLLIQAGTQVDLIRIDNQGRLRKALNSFQSKMSLSPSCYVEESRDFMVLKQGGDAVRRFRDFSDQPFQLGDAAAAATDTRLFLLDFHRLMAIQPTGFRIWQFVTTRHVFHLDLVAEGKGLAISHIQVRRRDGLAIYFWADGFIRVFCPDLPPLHNRYIPGRVLQAGRLERISVSPNQKTICFCRDPHSEILTIQDVESGPTRDMEPLENDVVVQTEILSDGTILVRGASQDVFVAGEKSLTGPVFHNARHLTRSRDGKQLAVIKDASGVRQWTLAQYRPVEQKLLLLTKEQDGGMVKWCSQTLLLHKSQAGISLQEIVSGQALPQTRKKDIIGGTLDIKGGAVKNDLMDLVCLVPGTLDYVHASIQTTEDKIITIFSVFRDKDGQKSTPLGQFASPLISVEKLQFEALDKTHYVTLVGSTIAFWEIDTEAGSIELSTTFACVDDVSYFSVLPDSSVAFYDGDTLRVYKHSFV